MVSLRPTTATATVCSGRITMHRKRLSQKGCTWFHFDLCLNFPQWMDNNAERRWAKNTHTLALTHTHTHAHAHTRTYTHAHTHTHTQTHTHKRTHTYKNTDAPVIPPKEIPAFA